tara:strand:+ start:429 stop:1451 length:1023 start_codon:yes stop_codon:yes gene_type:complete
MIKEFDSLVQEIGFINWEAQTPDNINKTIEESVDLLKKIKIVFITHSIRYSCWKKFCKDVEEHSVTGVIIVDHYPKDWPCPTGCVIVEIQSIIDTMLNQIFDSGSLPTIQTHRKIDQLPYSFFLPVYSLDQSRALIQRHLSILGIDQQALMSTPNIPAGSLLLDDRDPWLVNAELSRAQTAKTFDSKQELSYEKRFNIGGANVDAMITALQKCRFAIAMDNNPGWMDASAFMTEKMMWAFWAGIPVIWLCNPKKRSLLESWGFRDSSDGFDRLIHPDENTIPCWIAEIATLERLVTSSVSQRWQDGQAERVYKNYEAVQTLRARLHEEQWQEWQKIKDLI